MCLTVQSLPGYVNKGILILLNIGVDYNLIGYFCCGQRAACAKWSDKWKTLSLTLSFTLSLPPSALIGLEESGGKPLELFNVISVVWHIHYCDHVIGDRRIDIDSWLYVG